MRARGRRAQQDASATSARCASSPGSAAYARAVAATPSRSAASWRSAMQASRTRVAHRFEIGGARRPPAPARTPDARPDSTRSAPSTRPGRRRRRRARRRRRSCARAPPRCAATTRSRTDTDRRMRATAAESARAAMPATTARARRLALASRRAKQTCAKRTRPAARRRRGARRTRRAASLRRSAREPHRRAGARSSARRGGAAPARRSRPCRARAPRDSGPRGAASSLPANAMLLTSRSRTTASSRSSPSRRASRASTSSSSASRSSSACTRAIGRGAVLARVAAARSATRVAGIATGCGVAKRPLGGEEQRAEQREVEQVSSRTHRAYDAPPGGFHHVVRDFESGRAAARTARAPRHPHHAVLLRCALGAAHRAGRLRADLHERLRRLGRARRPAGHRPASRTARWSTWATRSPARSRCR